LGGSGARDGLLLFTLNHAAAQKKHAHVCAKNARSGRYVAIFGMNEKHNELNPVFYDKEALTLNESGTFWYSDTPSVPQSKWACSAFPRIATWARCVRCF
jgi:hypothetical protein